MRFFIHLLCIVLVCFGIVGGCGGGSDSGSIVSNLINGDNFLNAKTFWECYNVETDTNEFDIEFYPNGEGTTILYTDIGPFIVSSTYSVSDSQLSWVIIDDTPDNASDDVSLDFNILSSSETLLQLNLFQTTFQGEKSDEDVSYDCNLESYN